MNDRIHTGTLITDLISLVESAEHKAELRASIASHHEYCGVCVTEFSGRKAITFCSDCSIELCKPCATVCCLDIFCDPCLANHQKGHVFA